MLREVASRPPLSPSRSPVLESRRAAKYLEVEKRLNGMNASRLPANPTYASGYAEGRHAAKEHVPATENPFRHGTPAYQGWTDGHYDEQSARTLAIARHSTAVWGCN